MMPLDLSLYLVLDLASATMPERSAAEALRGGVTVMQLRDKRPDTSVLASVFARVFPWARSAGVPLILNDRVELALELGADGVHLGRNDMPPARARELSKKAGRRNFIIGLSATHPQQLRDGGEAVVDYVSVSPVFGTATKTDIEPPVGLEGVSALRKAFPRKPIVAIGGIKADNLSDVIRAGADGVAVVSGILRGRNRTALCRTYAELVKSALSERQEEVSLCGKDRS